MRSSAQGFGEADIELTYYWRLPVLSNENPNNWLLNIAPDAYLYGAALQYVPWAQEDENYNLWNTYYVGSVKGVKESNHANPRGGWATQRARPYLSAYTVIGPAMLFSALGRNMGVY